ncbi:hypothetical protein DV736_g6111, partial [Chaetothyriales sp. CBS 134916]
MIEPTKWTHLNYAFALIDPSTFEIAQMNDFDTELYPIFTGLKEHNPALEIFISVGGWSAGGQIFSDMTATAANRAAFISSAITFMKTYAFDGIDIDWEYPVAPDRGGNAADFDNYVTFLKELRAACGTAYGITATLPSSYWYMQNFDIASMEPYLDWFNIMTYDIHGTWDGNNPYTKAVVQAHTNLTEIDEALDLLWRNDIDSSKVVLGLAFYGRSFTLKDSSCSTPGCPFASGGTPGKCTQTSGILSDSEIQALISQYDIVPTLDSDAGVKYMTWNDDQWVSYDDAQTFAMKVNYANKLCLGGTMEVETGSIASSALHLMSEPEVANGAQGETAKIATHNSIWSKVWITKTYVNPNGKRVSPRCQRDEWPPAHFQQGLPAGYIRLLPGSQNEGVAVSGLGGWKGFCKYPPEKQVKVEGGPIQVIGDIVYVTSITSTITTINVMDYSFFNMGAPQADPWLLTDNPCYPSTLTQDPGFALLTWDPYYGLVPTRLPYSEPPTAQYTSGKTPPSKRDLSLEETYPHFVMDGQSNKILVDEGNSTRKATDEEMLEYFGLLKCRTEDCAQELDEYDQVVQAIQNAARTPSWAAADEESITTTNPHSEAPTQAPAMGSRSNPDLIADSIASVTAQVETASSPTSTASSSQVTAYKYHAHRGLLSRRGHKSRH